MPSVAVLQEAQAVSDPVESLRRQEEVVRAQHAKLGKAASPKNYLFIEIGYSYRIMLPYAQGMLLLEALSTVEQVEDLYSSRPVIKPISREVVSTRIISDMEYRAIKTAQLLDMPLNDVLAILEKPQPST